MPQPTDLCSALEAKLELAEKALSYSNQNLQLTMQMWIQGWPQDQRLLAKRAENCSEIALLVQKIQNEIQSEDEKRLLDAATPHSILIADDGKLFHQTAPGENYVEAENVTANVMLPLLLDNASWKAFVELLRARLKVAELTDENSEAMTARARELVRQNQVLRASSPNASVSKRGFRNWPRLLSAPTRPSRFSPWAAPSSVGTGVPRPFTAIGRRSPGTLPILLDPSG